MSASSEPPLRRPGSPPRQRAPLGSLVSCAQESFIVDGSTTAALFLAGEIDLSTDSHLGDALAGLLECPSDNVVVDMTRVGFCSVSGYVLLLDTARAAGAEGRRFAVVARSAQFVRACTLFWPDQHVTRHDTFTAAIAEIRTARRGGPWRIGRTGTALRSVRDVSSRRGR